MEKSKNWTIQFSHIKKNLFGDLECGLLVHFRRRHVQRLFGGLT